MASGGASSGFLASLGRAVGNDVRFPLRPSAPRAVHPSHPRHLPVPDEKRGRRGVVVVRLRPRHAAHEAIRSGIRSAAGATARPLAACKAMCFATRSASLLVPPISIDVNECRKSSPTK